MTSVAGVGILRTGTGICECRGSGMYSLAGLLLIGRTGDTGDIGLVMGRMVARNISSIDSFRGDFLLGGLCIVLLFGAENFRCETSGLFGKGGQTFWSCR